MEFTCSNPKCGQQLEIADAYAGQNAQCPFCQATVMVPVSLSKRSKGISRVLAWSLGVVGALVVVAATTIAFISTNKNSIPLTHASAGDLGLPREGERAKLPTTNRNVTFGGSWAGEQPSAPHVNRVVFKRDTFPCEGEIRFSSSTGKLRFDERNTSFPFDGDEVKVLEGTNIQVVVPVSWDRVGDNLVARHAKAATETVAKVKLVGSFLGGEALIPLGIRTFLDGVAAIRIDRFQKVESGTESHTTVNGSKSEESEGDSSSPRSILVAKGRELAGRLGLNPIALVVKNDSIVMVDGRLRIQNGEMGLADGDLVYNVDSKSIVVNEATLQPRECAAVRDGKVEKIPERLTSGTAGTATSTASGRWTGTTTNNTLWLRVSFEVVAGGSEMVGINYRIGHEGQGDDKPGVTWPSKGTAQTGINSDGSFRFVDEHNNFIEGKFTSPISAQGRITQGPFKLRCLDGVSRFPPTEWRAKRE